MATLGFDIKADASGLDDLRRKFDTVIGTMGSGVQLGIGAMMGKALGNQLGAAVSAARGVETLQISYETLVGSASEAEKVLKGLQDLGAKTPMSFEELGVAGKLLLQAGVATGNLNAELTTLGNLASLANVPITDVAAIYLKGANKGKIETEQLNQLAERGIPIIRSLARHFGVAEKAIYDMASKGKIQFKDLKKSLDDLGNESGGDYGGQMLKMSKTGGGIQSTLDDTITGVKREMGANVDGLWKPVMESGIYWIEKLTNGIKSISGPLKEVIVMGAALGAVFGVSKVIEKITAVTKGIMSWGSALENTGKAATGATVATGKMSAGLKQGVSSATAQAGLTTRALDKMRGGFMQGAAAAIGMQAAVMGIALATQAVVEKADKLKGLYEGAMDPENNVASASKYMSALEQGNSGIASRDDQAAKVKELDDQIEAKQKKYGELRTVMAGSSHMFDDMAGMQASLDKYKADIDLLRRAKEATRALSKADMERVRLLEVQKEAERGALEITQKKAEDVSKLKDDFLKTATGVKEDSVLGDNFEAQKRYYEGQRYNLMSGYGDENEMEKEALMKSGEGSSEDDRAQASELFVKLKEIYELTGKIHKVEKDITKEEDNKKEVLRSLAQEYEKNVTLAEAEIRGEWEKVRAIKEKIEQERIYNDMIKAGYTAERAQRESARQSKAIANVERLERDKSLSDVLTGVRQREFASKSALGEDALEIVNRAQELMDKFGEDGMSREQADKIAFKEYSVNRMSSKELGVGAVSSLAAVGGGGGVERGLRQVSESQLAELKTVVALLRDIKGKSSNSNTL